MGVTSSSLCVVRDLKTYFPLAIFLGLNKEGGITIFVITADLKSLLVLILYPRLLLPLLFSHSFSWDNIHKTNTVFSLKVVYGVHLAELLKPWNSLTLNITHQMMDVFLWIFHWSFFTFAIKHLAIKLSSLLSTSPLPLLGLLQSQSSFSLCNYV